MSKSVPQSIIKELQSKKAAGLPENEIRRWFRGRLNLKKNQGNTRYNEIVNGFDKMGVEFGDADEGESLQFLSDKYVYNEVSDSYVINLRCQSKPLVVSGSKHRAICRSYSEWGENLTCDDIVKKYALTPTVFDEYRRVFGLTKGRSHYPPRKYSIQTLRIVLPKLLRRNDTRFIRVTRRRVGRRLKILPINGNDSKPKH